MLRWYGEMYSHVATRIKHSSSCPLLLSFLFNVNIIPATLSSSELAVVVPGWGWVAVQVVGGKFRYKRQGVKSPGPPGHSARLIASRQ